MGGGVKLIETMSQNMQFFFLTASLIYYWLKKIEHQNRDVLRSESEEARLSGYEAWIGMISLHQLQIFTRLKY